MTPEKRVLAVQLARKGMSLKGIAHRLGMSKETFIEKRREDPSLDAEVYAALAEYEEGMIDALHGYRDSDDVASAKVVQDMLARRFPERHGNDPRLRDMSLEDHLEDRTEKRDAPSGRLDDAINAFLDAREAGKE